MQLPKAPFYRRWSVLLAGVIVLAAIVALLGWRGLQQVEEADPPTTTIAPPTTVVTSVAEASVHLPQPVVIGGHALVDAVSSASVDVVSAATSRFK